MARENDSGVGIVSCCCVRWLGSTGEVVGAEREGDEASKEGKYAESTRIVEKALRQTEKTFGSDHPHVALCLTYLAILHERQGKHSEAESLFRRSLAIYEKALGPDHPDVRSALKGWRLRMCRRRSMPRQGGFLSDH